MDGDGSRCPATSGSTHRVGAIHELPWSLTVVVGRFGGRAGNPAVQNIQQLNSLDSE